MSAINLALLELMDPSAFTPVGKLWMHNKLSVYNYALLTMYTSKWVTIQKLSQIYWDNVYKH